MRNNEWPILINLNVCIYGTQATEHMQLIWIYVPATDHIQSTHEISYNLM